MYFMVRPQAAFMFHATGRKHVRYICRLEDIGRDFELIREKMGLKTPLPHRNRSEDDRPWLADLNAASCARIADLYRRDFELLGYPTQV